MRETKGEGTTLRAEATPSLDLVFDLLSNSRRRYALYHLSDQPDGVATIESLTENVMEIEQTTDGDEKDGSNTSAQSEHAQDSPDARSGVQLELQHVHLPKLEDAGILEHDRRSETVRYWSQPSVEEWLEHAEYKERR